MLRHTFALATIAAALCACSNVTAPEPTAIDTPTVTAGGYQLIKVNGALTALDTPYQYHYRAEGDTLDTFVQIMTAVACVSEDGRFSFLRVLGSGHANRHGEMVDDGQQFGGYTDTRGAVTALSDGSYQWVGVMMQNGRAVQMNARPSHDSLTVTIAAEQATYLLIEAGPGSPMRDNCRAAGF